MIFLQIWPESGAVELPVGATNCTARGGKGAQIGSLNVVILRVTVV